MATSPEFASAATLLTNLAAWSAALSWEGLPGPVRHAARRALVDTIGVTLAGAATPLVARLRAHARECYGDGDCWLAGAPQGAAQGKKKEGPPHTDR